MDREDLNSTYIVCNTGVYSVEQSEKFNYNETPIVVREDPNIPLNKNGIPISREMQRRIIKEAAERVKRRTQNIVLTRFNSDNTLVDKVN